MNEIITLMNNRKSDRVFSGESVKQEDLDLILRTVQHAPTSIGAQQISLVVVEDKETIQKIAEYTGGQPQVASADKFVCVVVDFNRTKEGLQLIGKDQTVTSMVEGLLVGAVDAGIMVGALDTVIKSLGYGSTVIGGIRNNPQGMIDLLGLPQLTFPMVGITLGVISPEDTAQCKPRVPFESWAMYGRYDADKVKQGVLTYDKQLREWWDKQKLEEMPSYAGATARFYSALYYPNVKPTLEKQGFTMEH